MIFLFPFELSLSKPRLSFGGGDEGHPFDKLRANGAWFK
jgi:hypothetical protein